MKQWATTLDDVLKYFHLDRDLCACLAVWGVCGGMTYVYKLVRPRAPTMWAPWMRVQVPPDQGFSMGTIVPPKGRLAMSADTSVVTARVESATGTKCVQTGRLPVVL